MGERARTTLDPVWSCERCGARSELDATGDTPRLRCAACTHVVDVALVPASIGKWTVVDPDGIVRHFSSWQELMGSLPLSGMTASVDPSGAMRTTRASAAALLDVTPAPALVSPLPERPAEPLPSVKPAPRLSLVPGDDPPPLPRNRVPRIDPPTIEPIEELEELEPLPPSLPNMPLAAEAASE
ncbi:MAG: hypothetical protein JWP87_2752, partial [Labilithrix sp.]|nr:hypothetical protein [Labilithrix sp.]